MIDILKEKHIVMKMESSDIKNAKMSVLNEIRTLEMLERNEITDKMQYKWFSKMLNNRDNASSIYKEQNRIDLYEKEQNEKNVILDYMKELEKSLPKQLTDNEIKDIILKLKSDNPNCNIGTIMKYFSTNYPEQNKATISKLFKEIG